jgi:hypothetical protein
MFRPPNMLWTLIFFGVVLALPLPPAQRSNADPDGDALQPPLADGNGAQIDAEGQRINEAELEARLLARMRHELHGEVEQLAMQSMEQAVRRLRDREGSAPGRPMGKVLRLTFQMIPEMDGVAPVSVITRMTNYSAFADTFSNGTSFRLNVAGDLNLKGRRHDRVVVDFSTLLRFEDAGNDDRGSAGATGSAELAIGEPEVLMSVGARDLVLTVDEVGLP